MAGNVYRFDPAPQQRRVTAPLPAVFDSPPFRGPIALAALCVILSAWPQTGEPRLPTQYRAAQIAPLTLVYGSQPAPNAVLEVEESTVLTAWQPPWTPAQSAAPTAGWNVPVTSTYIPAPRLPSAILSAWQPPFISPPAPVSVAPRTLVYGSQPTPNATLEVEESTVVQAWQPAWYPAQSAAPNAGWNVPVVSGYIAPTRFPDAILSAWQPAWGPWPNTRKWLAPLLPGGDQPPVCGPQSEAVRSAVRAWPSVWWGAQRSGLVVQFVGPPLRRGLELPPAILASWIPRSGPIPALLRVITPPPLVRAETVYTTGTIYPTVQTVGAIPSPVKTSGSCGRYVGDSITRTYTMALDDPDTSISSTLLDVSGSPGMG